MAAAIEEAAKVTLPATNPTRSDKDTKDQNEEQKITLVLPKTDEILAKPPVVKPRISINIPSLVSMFAQVPMWMRAGFGLVLISLFALFSLAGESRGQSWKGSRPRHPWYKAERIK